MDNILRNDDISRLFREHDNIGSDSSLWFRPLRQLFKDGKPVGQAIVLTISPTEQQRLPLGILAQTKNNRIIFWPILPRDIKIACADEKIDIFDHITLELPSEKIHVTAYDTSGQVIHKKRAWRLHQFANCPLALWFTLLVRFSILRQQDMAVQRRVKMPTTDEERRANEINCYISNLKFLNVSLPHCDIQHDYACCVLYLAAESFTKDQFPPSVVPTNSLASEIEGWPDGNQFHVMVSLLKLGQRTICLATSCPPGRLRLGSDVSVGFPQSWGLKTINHNLTNRSTRTKKD
ncbi:MAG: hypothetical protein A2Z38_05325 [Planctomycetes bacterium RBG_19FT_COMBO_48_8]|nr:MAG: hypothetical protein A2Z38_05325 [Planctomycetes bacterium RBG_19FT_COMBO_48_8]